MSAAAAGSGREAELGEAGQEAVRLMDSVRRWWLTRLSATAPHEADDTCDSAPASADGVQRSADQADDQAQAHEQLCVSCPWCRLMAMVRTEHPEILTQLTVAADTAVTVARDLLRHLDVPRHGDPEPPARTADASTSARAADPESR
ncbi:MAG: hypothetical protein ACRC35_09910 [Angustibacter sp.]